MKRNHFFILAGSLLFGAAVLLGGCSQMPLLDPKGPIGAADRSVIIEAFLLMLIVVIPVWIMAVWFPLKYRAGNKKATYAPKWSTSVAIEAIVWLVPAAIVISLGILVWNGSHRLDPYKAIVSDEKPITIEAVSLDWKWLFIYPDLNIATVNQLVFPAKVPLNFRLTSTTVMTSFFIPQLGSQVYAMGGMQTRLHLLADEPGTYEGQNQQFSGEGFAGMHFKAIAMPREQFEAWVQKAKTAPDTLDLARFERLAKPSTGVPVTTFSSVMPGLFKYILKKHGYPEMKAVPMAGKSDSAPQEPRSSRRR